MPQDLAKAKELIQKAAEQLTAAAQLADRHAAYVKRRDSEVVVARSLLDGSEPLVAEGLKAVETSLREAADAAKAQNYALATTATDQALAKMVEITAAKDYSDRLKARLPLLEAALDKVRNSVARPGAPSTTAEAVRLKKVFDDTKLALGKAPADLKALDTALTQAQSASEALVARALLSAPGSGKDAVKLQMEALMKQGGGQALLDKLIADMGPADDPTHVLAALETRFKLQSAADEGVGTGKAGMAELKRIYKLMAEVPAKHTKNNPNLSKVTRKPSGGSAYGGGDMTLGDGPDTITLPRKVYGGTGDPPPNCLGNPEQVPDVDESCRLDPTADAPQFFDWNVQHEIAHALDDRKSFMDTRVGNADFGAWENHGGDVLAVAAAAETEFASLGPITRQMIANYLDKGVDPGVPPAGWTVVKAWADKTDSGADPWDKGALCAMPARSGGLMLGARVYHQAYPSDWYSYAAAARKQGITGYQFRSPGEWFSELYAAYRSKVLKPSHPANAWLSKLFGDAKKKAKAPA